MAAEERYKSDARILLELEQLSESLDHRPRAKTRRNASLALHRNAATPDLTERHHHDGSLAVDPRPRSRRMSLSPWRSRTSQSEVEEEETSKHRAVEESRGYNKWADENPSEKKGIWNWKPIRALTHITMQKLSCLFSVEVVAVQNLPPSMSGLRLTVRVRKKETKDGSVQTMPSRVSEGAADFEETLFIRCHVYFTPGTGIQLKFEPRSFYIYVVAVDAPALDFGRSNVDVTSLIQDSIKKSFEGTRITQWDKIFSLTGKAKGGELLLKLGFQIMEKDGGFEIFRQTQGGKQADGTARSQSKTSFSVPSPKLSRRAGPLSPYIPSQKASVSDFQDNDYLNLDEPATAPPPQTSNPKKAEENDFPEFDVVDKGVEIEVIENDSEEGDEDEVHSEDVFSDKGTVSSEVAKEVVQDHSLFKGLPELDSIALQIKALESMVGEGNTERIGEEESSSQLLDADEDEVTREFFQLLEDDVQDYKFRNLDDLDLSKLKTGSNDEGETEIFLSDLGKGLGCIVQTRHGGFLAAMNPLDTPVGRKDTPKLAMQITKPMVILSEKASGFEFFQKMARVGLQELTSGILSVMPIDELMGKTAEQIAFEGIASAIILGRNKERASSSAARTIGALKSMANAMNIGRKDRISSGIWNVSGDPLTADEILPFSIQKIESMVMKALKIQADAADEEAPFDVSPEKASDNIFASTVPVDDWAKQNNNNNKATETITIAVIIQLRDPLRQYEAVGGPMIALIQVSTVDRENAEEEKRYKVGNLQVGGIKLRNPGTNCSWDGEKQKLTALQWLMAYGFVKSGGKKVKRAPTKRSDILWSLTARVMADMWLKPIRNPDVKFT